MKSTVHVLFLLALDSMLNSDEKKYLRLISTNTCVLVFCFLTLLIPTFSNLQKANAVSFRIDDLPAGNSVFPPFQITPDGSKVVYISRLGLRVVPIEGGTNTRLNNFEWPVRDYGISPDSAFVVYSDDEDTSGTAELYSVPISGGMPVKLNGTVFPGTDIELEEVRFTPDSQYVVFKARETIDTIELFSSPIAGGGSVKINFPLPDGFTLTNDIPNEPFVISEDSSTVIYNQRPKDSTGTPYSTIYSVPVTGGTATQLALSSGQDVGIATRSLQITPDGETLTYVLSGGESAGLYKTPFAGGSATLLTPPSVLLSPYFISPDSSRLLYRGREDGSSNDELFSVSLIDGAITKVSDPNMGAVDVGAFDVTPDGNAVVFRAAAEATIESKLFSSPSAGGENIPLTPSLPSLALGKYQISPDGKNVVFTSSVLNPQKRYELFSVPVSGGEIIKLNSPLYEFGGVIDFEITPNGNTVVYTATPDSSDYLEMFRVPIAGGQATRIDSPTSDDTTVDFSTGARFQISSDGRFAVYRVLNRSTFHSLEMHAAVIIPEPTTCTLALAALCLVVSRRRQR